MDWSALALDKASPVPLYHQLAEAIRERVRLGALPPGDRLPPERELAEKVGISRMTARQAVAELARDGALDVRHGVGTFVAAPKLTYDALHLLGFTEETLRLGGTAATRVLSQAVAPPPAPVAARLDLDPAEPAVEIVRLRSVGGEPLLLETSWVPRAACPGLEGEDLARRSLYDLLEGRYGHRLGEARQTVEATTAGDGDAPLLGVAVGSPVLLVEGVALTERGRPIEAFTAIYRADRVRFALASRREASGNGAAATEREVSLVMR
jgi:GntR family transcriptional regulator